MGRRALAPADRADRPRHAGRRGGRPALRGALRRDARRDRRRARLAAVEGAGLPPRLRRVAEAVIGVVLGTFVTLATLEEIGADLAPILAATVATLGLSVLGGLALARWTGLDRPTAAFGTIAGGATGIIVMARDLGADERMVAVLQYLRVVVVVLLTPVVAAVAFGGTGAATGERRRRRAPRARVRRRLRGRRARARAPAAAGARAHAAAARSGSPPCSRSSARPGVAPLPSCCSSSRSARSASRSGCASPRRACARPGGCSLPALVLIAALLVASFGLALALAPAGRGEHADRLPGHHPRRALRGARGRGRLRRGRDVRARRPGPAAARDAARGAAAGAAPAACRGAPPECRGRAGPVDQAPGDGPPGRGARARAPARASQATCASTSSKRRSRAASAPSHHRRATRSGGAELRRRTPRRTSGRGRRGRGATCGLKTKSRRGRPVDVDQPAVVAPADVVAVDAPRLLLQPRGHLDVPGPADPAELGADPDRVADVLQGVRADDEVEAVVGERERLAGADVVLDPRLRADALAARSTAGP